jgi:hypothetical protein
MPPPLEDDPSGMIEEPANGDQSEAAEMLPFC